ncbi:MAG: hypothetical protein GDA56_16475 [Hormoscilla sp. GM7CHS1pb]|nr:hypothetical protein [Hormoscilla sp. GM7CHS1pb]
MQEKFVRNTPPRSSLVRDRWYHSQGAVANSFKAVCQKSIEKEYDWRNALCMPQQLQDDLNGTVE